MYAVYDGLKLYLEQSGDKLIQNIFYYWFTHDHYVGNVFVFAPNNKIVACAINAPGSMNESMIAKCGGVYETLQKKFDLCRGQVVLCSAFAKVKYIFLIRSAMDEKNADRPDEVLKIRQETCMRQASKWGMSAFKGTFQRMKDRFAYE